MPSRLLCQCASPNIARATKNDTHDWWVSLCVAQETSFTMREATGLTPQSHQIVCLPRKMTLLVTYETSFTMRGASEVTLQRHQILRLPRKMTIQNLTEICWKQQKRHLHWSEHVPVSPQPAAQPRWLFALATSILHEKLHHFAFQLSFQISPNTAPATSSDTRTSPHTAPATKRDTWISPNIVPGTESDTWTIPNSTPATKSDTWTWPNHARETKMTLKIVSCLCYYLTPLFESIITWVYYLTLLLLDLLLDCTVTLLCDVIRISEVSPPKLLIFASKLRERVISEKKQCASHPRYFPRADRFTTLTLQHIEG